MTVIDDENDYDTWSTEQLQELALFYCLDIEGLCREEIIDVIKECEEV